MEHVFFVVAEYDPPVLFRDDSAYVSTGAGMYDWIEMRPGQRLCGCVRRMLGPGMPYAVADPGCAVCGGCGACADRAQRMLVARSLACRVRSGKERHDERSDGRER